MRAGVFLSSALLCAASALAQEPVPSAAEPSGGVLREGAEVRASTASGDFDAEARVGLRASAMAVQHFATDNVGTQLKDDPVDTRIRLGGEVGWKRLHVIAQGDVLAGAANGVPTDPALYLDGPHPKVANGLLRELYLEYKAPTWLFRLGQQTSDWGLGLVASGSTHDAAAGEAFGDVRFGDLVYRALLAGRPFFGWGGAWRAIEPAVAVDMVSRDETATYDAGDRAVQGVFALRFAKDDQDWFGVYVVRRHQYGLGADSATRKLDATVLDVAGKWHWPRAVLRGTLSLGAEAAYTAGTTTLAASPQAAQQDVRQWGAAAKASLRFRRWELYLDLGYASGDQNPYGTQLTGFHFNPDYTAGLVMFQEVLGWQTARSAARASDPNIVGVPPAGVQLIPSRGGVFDAAYVFPRARYGVRPWLDIYGGPLFAFATAKLTDPYNTSAYGGGSPLNALGGSPGNYLGTEFDLGVQVRAEPEGVPVTATAEAGYFVPGDAFADASGAAMPPVFAGRLRLAIPF